MQPGSLPPAPYLLARWTIWLAMAGFGVGVVLLAWMLADPIEFDPDAGGIAQTIFSGILTHPPTLVLITYGAVYYVVSSLWLHRSRKFATALNTYHSQRLGAAWVWLGWLVPIVNLWFSYLVVRDIKAATDGGDQGRSAVEWWWLLSIAAGVLSQQDGAFFAVLSALAALVGLGYWLSIVTDIANRQQGHVRAAHAPPEAQRDGIAGVELFLDHRAAGPFNPLASRRETCFDGEVAFLPV